MPISFLCSMNFSGYSFWFHLVDDGLHIAVDEVADSLDEELFFLGDGEVHVRVHLCQWSASGVGTDGVGIPVASSPSSVSASSRRRALGTLPLATRGKLALVP